MAWFYLGYYISRVTIIVNLADFHDFVSFVIMLEVYYINC